MRIAAWVGVALVVGVAASTPAGAQSGGARTLTFRFVPTARAQIAIWVESADGKRFATLALTEATCLRGIGNRPGASQMNSGYHWPYGRREGVLPIWAHRRAAVPGALLWQRVIFQNRPEGYASRTVEDSTPDSYFCLPFSGNTGRDGLDAVTCASPFNSDKGRFLTTTDASRNYAEPFVTGASGTMRPLGTTSLYPPRRDIVGCMAPGCLDSPDVASFTTEARRVMPNLDAISMPTPPDGASAIVSLEIPSDWPDGDYLAFLEINTEGDYNASYDPTTYPTPQLPTGAWDSWAVTYGYSFRGQPSVLFRLPLLVGATEAVSTLDPAGYGSLDGVGATGGDIHAIDSTISNDPTGAPGSGVDRLRISNGYRLRVEVGRGHVDGGADAADAQDGSMDAAESDGGAVADGSADGPADAVSSIDAPQGADAGVGVCVANPDCPLGQYCGSKGRCTFDCLRDTDCNADMRCSGLGKCVVRASAGGCSCLVPAGATGEVPLACVALLVLAVSRLRRRHA